MARAGRRSLYKNETCVTNATPNVAANSNEFDPIDASGVNPSRRPSVRRDPNRLGLQRP